jgi:hypothetical protein
LLDDLFGQLDLGQGAGQAAGQGAAGHPPAPAASAAPPSPESVFGGPPKASGLSSSSAATTGLEDLFGGAVPAAAPAKPQGAPPIVSTPAPPAQGAQQGKSIVSALANMPAPRPSDPFEAALAGTLDLALGPLGGNGSTPGSDGLSFEPLPSRAAAPSFGGQGAAFEDPLAGLDLDAPASAPPPGPDPTHFLADENAGSEFDLGLGMDDTRTSAPSAPPVTEGAPPPAPMPELTTAAATVRRVVPTQGAAPAPEEKSLFSLIFNGLGSAVIIAAVFFGFVASRNGWKVDLREPGRSLSTAFGRGGAAGGALDIPVRVTGSGYYPTLSDQQLMFVSGRVTNSGPSPLRIQVNLDVIDSGGQALAHGRGWPGRVPTPEDLFGVAGPADLDKLDQHLLQDAPPTIAPGATVDFVVVVEKPARGTDGCELRVRAEPFRAQAATEAHPAPVAPSADKPVGQITAATAAGR